MVTYGLHMLCTFGLFFCAIAVMLYGVHIWSLGIRHYPHEMSTAALPHAWELLLIMHHQGQFEVCNLSQLPTAAQRGTKAAYAQNNWVCVSCCCALLVLSLVGNRKSFQGSEPQRQASTGPLVLMTPKSTHPYTNPILCILSFPRS